MKKPIASKAVARRGKSPVAAKSLAIGGVTWEFQLPGTSFNYPREVGDGLRSGVIVATLTWLMRTFPEAPIVVERRTGDLWEIQHGHKLEQLLEQPNPFYDGRVLWMATILDFAFGEAYWQKVRNGADEVVELWWIPRALIKPIYDDNQWPGVFIHHYNYMPGRATPIELAPRDVVHFRFGMDPRDIRRGFSQLAAIFREVYIDDQAANFTASILRNFGIIGLIFSPKTGAPGIQPGKLAEFKQHVQENFTGDKRGQAMAFSHPIDAQLLQYNLQGFDVGPIRDIAEERVSAAIGIPAAVVGFGTGLQQTKVGATMEQMIRLVWRQKIMPEQKIMAGELKRSLIGDFQTNENLFRVRFDASKIHALWEDELQKAQRIAALVDGSILTVGQGLKELGYPAPKVDFYLRKVTQQAVPADDPMAQVARITQTVPSLPTDIVQDPGKEKPPPEGTADNVP